MAEQMIHVGAEFTCFDDLEAAINQYESTKYINLYKRSSRTIAAFCKNRTAKKPIPEELKFAELDYACIHGGKNFKSTSEGARPNQSTYQMRCPVVLSVRLSQDWQKLVVKKLTEEHNHQISEVAYKHLPRQRRIDPQTRKEVNRMLNFKANKKLIQQHVLQSTGRILTVKDLHNSVRSCEADDKNDFEALLDEMKKEPGSVTEVVVGPNYELQGIYYQDYKMQQIQRAFPELMLIDATYKLNDLRMPLYVLMSVDSNGERHVIALWIVSSVRRATVAALADIFVRLNRADQIKCIIMADKDMVERDVMREKIPHAALQICLFHTLKMFCQEITSEEMAILSEQKQSILEIIQKMINAKDKDEYVKYHETLCELNIQHVTDYVNTHWQDIKMQWVEGLKSQPTNFLTSTNNRVESINQKLRSVISKYSGMVTFFQDLKTVLAVLETERNQLTLQIVQKSSTVQSSPNSPESQYLRLLMQYTSWFVSTRLSAASFPITTAPDDATTTNSLTEPTSVIGVIDPNPTSTTPSNEDKQITQNPLSRLPEPDPALSVSQPNPDPASTTSNADIDLSLVTLSPTRPKRGRPKGSKLTVIGFPTKRARTTKRPILFKMKAPADKDRLILSWLVSEEMVEHALEDDYKLLKTSLLPYERLPMKLLDDERIDIKQVQKYFTPDGWQEVTSITEKLRSEGQWLCKACDQPLDSSLSVGCEVCLEWYDGRCIGLKQAPKVKSWVCHNCRQPVIDDT